MKKLTFLIFAIGMAMMAAAKAPADTTVCFTVDPTMTCANCENKIKTNLRFEKGIKNIDASASRGTVDIKFNPEKTTVENIVKAFSKIGYKATPAKCVNAQQKDCCKKESKDCCKKESKGNCDKEAKNCHKEAKDCCKKESKGNCDKESKDCCKKESKSNCNKEAKNCCKK